MIDKSVGLSFLFLVEEYDKASDVIDEVPGVSSGIERRTSTVRCEWTRSRSGYGDEENNGHSQNHPMQSHEHFLLRSQVGLGPVRCGDAPRVSTKQEPRIAPIVSKEMRRRARLVAVDRSQPREGITGRRRRGKHASVLRVSTGVPASSLNPRVTRRRVAFSPISHLPPGSHPAELGRRHVSERPVRQPTGDEAPSPLPTGRGPATPKDPSLLRPV